VISIAWLHSIGNSANPSNLCVNNIAVVQLDRRLPRETDSRRCAGCDQVSWIEREAIRKTGDDLRHVENQLIRTRILYDFALQTCGDRKCAGSGNLVGRHAKRTVERKCVAPLAPRPLAVVKPPSSRGNIVEDDLAGNVPHGIALPYAPSFLANDDGQFAFKVDRASSAGV
jgi:hypothetical protein